ncbi:MAG TPA: GNAT family N-acetyltransferase [Actinomycetota bacterium]|jgi:GNAT superfamily N-acetyltransferase|nr:GNAT family N-acetyltransferase [Actinomycetota bacterium]
MSEHGLEFRHAMEADLEAEYEVFVAAQGELMHRHGLRWSAAPFEAWSAPHRHLLTADGERSFVALDGERLAGFSAALARGDTWFLAALFVSPDDQGRRVGRELLDRSWAGDWQRRMTITESIQPVSTGMYARRGLIPTTPILTLSGTPRCELPDGLQAVPPEPEVLATLDRGAYGFDRGTDHRFWGERAAQANLWLLDGEPIAYAYVDRQGLIGPLAGRDGATAALALRAELARRASQPAEVLLPGTTPGLVEAALASGLRLTRPPGLLLLSQGTDPPKALAISGYWLL